MLPSRPMAAWLLVLAACSSQHREPKDRPVEPATAGEEIAKEDAAIVPVSPDGYVVGINDAVALSCGMFHCCALRQTGKAACWGRGGDGQLGNGETNDSASAVDVATLTDLVGVSSGFNVSCAVTRLGSVFCWGAGVGGTRSNGDPRSVSTPHRVEGLGPAVQVSVGMFKTCAIKAGGAILCWRMGARPAPAFPPETPPAIAIDVGGLVACGLHEDGLVRCVRLIADGSEPIVVANDAIELAVGIGHGCAMLADQSMRCWADGSDLPGADAALPRGGARAPGGALQRSLAAGPSLSCAVLATGRTQCWGHAVAVSALPADPLALAATEQDLCALYESGRVKCTRRNQGTDEFR